jgi:hypothetical protein
MSDSNDHVADEAGDMDAVGKIENVGGGTPSSIESTPDPEQEQDAAAETAGIQEPALPQKRKGGRKPVRSSLWSR